MAETHQLVIVRRNQFATFALLAQAFADEPSVRLIWDRRLRDRRRGRGPRDPDDRRRRDRRSDASETWGRHNYLLLGAGERIESRTAQIEARTGPDLRMGEVASAGDVARDIEAAVKSDLAVMISGGDVVGRKSVACRIHAESDRGDRPLVVVERDSFIEVFGAVDAPRPLHGGTLQDDPPDTSHKTWIDAGTLLIEEIADLSGEQQTELSRFIERRAARRLELRPGGFREARIISGTSHLLLDRIASKQFRADLFYQLNTIHIVLPSGVEQTFE